MFFSIDVFPASAQPSSTTTCSRGFLGRLGYGFATSPNFPFDYGANLTCTYSVFLVPPTGASSSSYAVCLVFYRFALESSSPFCSFDYVEVDSNPSIKYCGAGLWQYGVEEKGNPMSNIWSANLCCKFRLDPPEGGSAGRPRVELTNIQSIFSVRISLLEVA